MCVSVHFSACRIELFEPRASNYTDEPVVWAIDAETFECLDECAGYFRKPGAKTPWQLPTEGFRVITSSARAGLMRGLSRGQEGSY